MKTAQIGKCGELLVQYQLLLREIESAPLTTDSGVDLVAYSPRNARPVTVQVKTNLRAKPAGGKGKEVLDWWVRPWRGVAQLQYVIHLFQAHLPEPTVSPYIDMMLALQSLG